jgi:hypothetical protein
MLVFSRVDLILSGREATGFSREVKICTEK